MDNYLSKLFQISPEFRPKSYDLNYKPNYNGQHYEGEYYPSNEQMYYEPFIMFEGEGGIDKNGKYIGGTLSGFMPMGNSSLSGRVSGNVSKYGKTTGQLSGAGINYSYGPYSVGVDYSNDPEMGGKNYLARGIFNY